jgi:hypothetical protein
MYYKMYPKVAIGGGSAASDWMGKLGRSESDQCWDTKEKRSEAEYGEEFALSNWRL